MTDAGRRGGLSWVGAWHACCGKAAAVDAHCQQPGAAACASGCTPDHATDTAAQLQPWEEPQAANIVSCPATAPEQPESGTMCHEEKRASPSDVQSTATAGAVVSVAQQTVATAELMSGVRTPTWTPSAHAYSSLTSGEDNLLSPFLSVQQSEQHAKPHGAESAHAGARNSAGCDRMGLGRATITVPRITITPAAGDAALMSMDWGTSTRSPCSYPTPDLFSSSHTSHTPHHTASPSNFRSYNGICTPTGAMRLAALPSPAVSFKGGGVEDRELPSSRAGRSSAGQLGVGYTRVYSHRSSGHLSTSLGHANTVSAAAAATALAGLVAGLPRFDVDSPYAAAGPWSNGLETAPASSPSPNAHMQGCALPCASGSGDGALYVQPTTPGSDAGARHTVGSTPYNHAGSTSYNGSSTPVFRTHVSLEGRRAWSTTPKGNVIRRPATTVDGCSMQVSHAATDGPQGSAGPLLSRPVIRPPASAPTGAQGALPPSIRSSQGVRAMLTWGLSDPPAVYTQCAAVGRVSTAPQLDLDSSLTGHGAQQAVPLVTGVTTWAASSPGLTGVVGLDSVYEDVVQQHELGVPEPMATSPDTAHESASCSPAARIRTGQPHGPHSATALTLPARRSYAGGLNVGPQQRDMSRRTGGSARTGTRSAHNRSMSGLEGLLIVAHLAAPKLKNGPGSDPARV